MMQFTKARCRIAPPGGAVAAILLTLGMGVSSLMAGTSSVSAAAPAAAPAPVPAPSWEPGKPITFGDGLGVIDVQVRERFEDRDNWIDFNRQTHTRDGIGLLERIRLGMQLNPTKDITLYAQAQDSRTFADHTAADGQGGAQAALQREFVTNDDPVALRQAYAKFSNIGCQPVTLVAGRQVLSYGDERLVGGLDWDNNARVFDATKVTYKDPSSHYSVDVFAALPVIAQSKEFDMPDASDLFTGVYATTGDLIPHFNTDGYVFIRDKSKVTAMSTFENTNNQSQGNISAAGDYVTLGTRMTSKPKAFCNWDFAYEGALQLGEIVDPIGPTDIRLPNTAYAGAGTRYAGAINTGRQRLVAGMSHVEGGYTFTTTCMTPRAFAMFDYASGDNNPTDSKSNTFQNLFPTNHKFYGIQDRFALSNIEQGTIGVSCKPTPKLTLVADWRNTWLDSTNDVWRYANQAPLGNNTTRYGNALIKNPSNYVGSEAEVVGTYAYAKWAKIQAGYSRFFAGDYIQQTAGSAVGAFTNIADDANFAYTQIQFDF